MNRTQYVVLVEDLRQEGFVYQMLVEQRVDRRRIRVRKSPHGKGSGEQFVAKEYPVEVRKQHAATGTCKPEAQKFLDLCRKGFAADAPPSMLQAREELRRVGI